MQNSFFQGEELVTAPGFSHHQEDYRQFSKTVWILEIPHFSLRGIPVVHMKWLGKALTLGGAWKREEGS